MQYDYKHIVDYNNSIITVVSIIIVRWLQLASFIVAEIVRKIRLPAVLWALLQWSRNLISAGALPAILGQVFTAMLQWGRTFIVAESFLYGILVENASALQWGRNFIVAETYG